ncbi:MAG: hypothetical protein L7U72_11775 [Rubripirellula sp.]|nr:hypothetical protein [Rubripirellula sp.]
MKEILRRFFTIAICALTLCVWSVAVHAQSPRQLKEATWQDLGLNLPPDFPTNEISLFEGMNLARGTWSFQAETVTGDSTTPIQGSLSIVGDPQSGMIPMWSMTWTWSAEDSENAIVFIVGAGPRKDGFDLMLTRIGPVKTTESKDAQRRVLPTIFEGTWNPETRTLTCMESDPPRGLRRQALVGDASKPKQVFDLVIAKDGKILVKQSQHMPAGQLASAEATVRTGQAPEMPSVLSGKHRFKSVTEITDPRIKPWLPPEATSISLMSDRGGHFARYEVAEGDFKNFMNKLWKEQGEGSAHKRESMSGEGEPASAESMVRRFEPLGWQPLGNAVIFYSPSKSTGAMTTYYYDRDAGIAYHDRGYW